MSTFISSLMDSTKCLFRDLDKVQKSVVEIESQGSPWWDKTIVKDPEKVSLRNISTINVSTSNGFKQSVNDPTHYNIYLTNI